MDINYLLKREQIELMRAVGSTSSEARRCHETMAAAYSARVAFIAFPTSRMRAEPETAKSHRRSLLGDSF
jgi:hypothetical protein